MTQPEQVKRVPRRELIKSWLTWLIFSHSTYNYERLQGLGFAHSMVPIIRALYKTKEDVVAALRRHLVFYNTEPQGGAIVHGVVIAMEEQRASGQDISDEAINGVKSGLMGPLAGLGDSITQGLITPILLALGISLAMEGNLAGPILYFILQAGAIIGLSYALWFGGYRWGRSMVDRLLAGGLLSRVTEAAGVLGMVVLGALAARQVSLSTVAQVTSGQQTVALQGDVLDTMMKGILPLLLTLGLWWLLSRRVSPMVIIGMIFVAGIDGVLLGWLGWAPSTVTWWSALGLAITVGLWWALLSPRVKPLHAAALLAIYWAFMLIWGRWNLSMFAGLATWAWAWWQAAGKPSASDETPA